MKKTRREEQPERLQLESCHIAWWLLVLSISAVGLFILGQSALNQSYYYNEYPHITKTQTPNPR